MKHIINLIVKVLIYFGLIDKTKLLILQPTVTDVKNLSGYVYSYTSYDNKHPLSSSFLVFNNPTLAVYTLILFCITYGRFDLRCNIVGYVDKDGSFFNFQDINYLDYFTTILAYTDYKNKYGDVTDVPLSKIEDAIIQCIFNYLTLNLRDVFDMDKDEFISNTVIKYNITSYPNEDIINKYKDSIKDTVNTLDNENKNIEVN